MSIEAAVLSAIVREGKSSLRKLYSEGISAEDFIVYREEMDWIEQRAMNREPINLRVFRKQFSDFDWMPVNEDLKDLIAELKEERLITEVQALLESTAQELGNSKPVKILEMLHEKAGQIRRLHSPQSRERVEGDIQAQMKEMRAGFKLAKSGIPTGIPTGFPHLDHHWGGLAPGRMHLLLGRPGSAKSYVIACFVWAAKKHAYNVGLFSPEMNTHEHRSRLHTLASAEPDIRKTLGLKQSFRNRALLDRRGFNLKHYQRLLEHLDEMPGNIHILSATHQREKMSVSYIEQQIEELSLDLAVIDPIYKLRPMYKGQHGWDKIADISDAIDDLTKQYNIPIVVSNQAHRQGNNVQNAPHKDTSFGSDVPVQNAAYALGVLHLSEDNLLIMRGTKSRFGAEFDCRYRFFPNTGYIKADTPLPKHSYFNGSDPANEDMEAIMAGVQKAIEA